MEVTPNGFVLHFYHLRQCFIPLTSTDLLAAAGFNWTKSAYCLVDDGISIMKWLTEKNDNIESYHKHNPTEHVGTDKSPIYQKQITVVAMEKHGWPVIKDLS